MILHNREKKLLLSFAQAKETRSIMKFIALLICISTKDDSNRETYSISKSHAHTFLASSLCSDFPSLFIQVDEEATRWDL